MSVREFSGVDYEHGCRCACCHRLFEDGDEMHDRLVDEWGGTPVTTPTCMRCAATNRPLGADHPCGPDVDRLTLCADGLVERDGHA